jgi:hypothetical protein
MISKIETEVTITISMTNSEVGVVAYYQTHVGSLKKFLGLEPLYRVAANLSMLCKLDVPYEPTVSGGELLVTITHVS